MAQFIIRAELLGTPAPDTTARLNAYMAAQGFQQAAPKSTGGVIKLPAATFWGEANGSAADLANYLRDGLQPALNMQARVLAIIFADAHQAEPIELQPAK